MRPGLQILDGRAGLGPAARCPARWPPIRRGSTSRPWWATAWAASSKSSIPKQPTGRRSTSTRAPASVSIWGCTAIRALSTSSSIAVRNPASTARMRALAASTWRPSTCTSAEHCCFSTSTGMCPGFRSRSAPPGSIRRVAVMTPRRSFPQASVAGFECPSTTGSSATLGVRGYVTLVDSDTAIFCVGSGDLNCLVRTSGSTFFQGEAFLGLNFRF